MRALCVIGLAAFLLGCGVGFSGNDGVSNSDGGAQAGGEAGSVGGGGAGGSGGMSVDAWSYRKTITIPAGQVEAPVDALTNYPLLVATNDADLDARALSDGGDIRFATLDGVMLDFEVEHYEAGQLFAWVRIPSLRASARCFDPVGCSCSGIGTPTPQETGPPG